MDSTFFRTEKTAGECVASHEHDELASTEKRSATVTSS